jgi:hypothetical protein|tara:strand:+ start:1221 stop:1580 length:360 start_codon:yes stop_codon:yes gene_type:complete
MAYTLRKVERYTNWEATSAVDLNSEDFKNLSIPFTGEGEVEFTKYIQDIYNEDWYELCDELEEAGKEKASDALSILFEGEMEVYSSTTNNEEDAWMEVGRVDEEYSKYGGFNSSFTTMD